MIKRIRRRTGSESGFTLVELLVVMLIIGILASIAVPSFYNQRMKASDAAAKEAVRTAQTSLETYSTDWGGTYVGGTGAALRLIESTVPPDCTGAAPNYTNPPCLLVSGLSATGYTVTVVAKTSLNQFQIVRTAGAITYPCSKPTTSSPSGGCTITSGTVGRWN